MKKTIIFLGILALVLNVAIGMLLSAYPMFNMVLNSIVIVITTMLIWLSSGNSQRTAFAVSLTFLYSFFGIIQLILGIISPARVTDNWMIVTIIALLVLECALLIITKTISKKVN
jgi:hypothetical protein